MKIQIKYHFYGQEKIVQWLTKKLETVKKSCFLYYFCRAAKITSKFFIVLVNWIKKRLFTEGATECVLQERVF